MTLGKLVLLVNRFGITVDYLLSDSVVSAEENQYKLWSQLMDGRTEEEKRLAINMVKLMFGYLDENA